MPEMDKERQMEQQRQQPQQQDKGQARNLGPGEPSPGLKDKDAPTSDTYGNTRESGEEPK